MRHRKTTTTPYRIFTKGEVLPYRQPFGADIPRASPPVKTATLSTALQADRDIFFILRQQRQREKKENGRMSRYIS